jgi:hypothetical protein
MSSLSPPSPDEVRRRVIQAEDDLDRRHPLWPAEVTVLVAILLGLLLPGELTLVDSWILPACEAALLVGLVATTPHPLTRDGPRRRAVRIGLVGIVSLVNLISLVLLVHALLGGPGSADGRQLLIGGAVLWLTALLLFAVWFWEVDRGGPVRRLLHRDARPDFLFPQMSEGSEWAPPDWQPRLADYLYLSLINASSFSPEETVPLTRTAKLLLALQIFASLITMVIVLAYAVNNLS